MKKVTIDTKMCIGCGVCASMAPDVFEMKAIEGELKAAVKDGIDRASKMASVEEAADACATNAIRIEECACVSREK